MRYFTIRKQYLFPSYTIDVKESEKLDRFLQLLEKSGVAEVIRSVVPEQADTMGRPAYNQYDLLAVILYGFAFGGGSLREIESACRNDLRYISLMQQEQPNFKTISNYINRYIVPNADMIFSKIVSAIFLECGICADDVYIDGTKIEADANKYKFVWKPTTFHNRLCDKVRTLLQINGLERGIPEFGIIDTKLIAAKLTEFSELLQRCSPAEEKKRREQYEQLRKYLLKALEYEEKERICGPDRNSYYKTDHDATAMTLKTDYYSGLGSHMHAAYTVQTAVAKGFVAAYYVSQSRTDMKDFIPTMERFRKFHGYYPKNICTDSGYGSIENYRYLQENGIGNYVKHQSWQGNVSGSNPDRYRLQDDETILCLGGRTGKQSPANGRHPKMAESVFYRVDGCCDCAFHEYCKRWQKEKTEDFKIFEVNKEMRRHIQEAEKNLLSPKGIEIRINRSIQAEGAFGVLKQNMRYVRVRRTSKEKVSTEIMLTLLGYNIRKLFRYFSGNLKANYWTAPSNLEQEEFKKPHAARLSKKAKTKKNKFVNEAARYSYKEKYKEH